MNILYGIEITDTGNHDIIEPFIDLVTSFKEYHSTFYIFASLDDVSYLKDELTDYKIIEAVHELYLLENPSCSAVFDDYGFQTIAGHAYLLKSMIASFRMKDGLEANKKLALLQFDEHLVASDGPCYFVDQHQQELIENIAKAYNISVSFFELDK
jgi:hypothetical protein